MSRADDLSLLVSHHAALVQLLDEAGDECAAIGRLPLLLLQQAIDQVRAEPNASSVSGLQFSLRDVAALAAELPEETGASFEREIAALEQLATELSETFALSVDVRSRIASLRRRLAERRSAIDAATFLEPGVVAPPLPHDPVELRADGVHLLTALRSAGFEPAALSLLVDAPERVHRAELSAIIDELDVVTGD